MVCGAVRWVNRTLREVHGALRELTSHSALSIPYKALFTQRTPVYHTQGYVYLASGFVITVYYKQLARSTPWEAEQFAGWQ